MFAALGRFVYRFRWPVIGGWLIVLALGVLVLTRFSVSLPGGGFTSPDMESMRVVQTLRDELRLSPSNVTVVFSDPQLTVDDAAYKQAVEATVGRLKEVDRVETINTFYTAGDPRLVSADRHTTYATVGLNVNPDNPGTVVHELRQRLEGGSPRALLTGDVAVYHDIDQVAHDDLVRAEVYALPISLAVLLLVFGTVVAAGLPVAMGGVAVVATLAGLYILARLTDVSVFSMNVVSMLGLGLGIDYSLLLVSRFREEMEHVGDVRRNVVNTVATAGKTVFFSGATVFIGLAGLLVYPLVILRSLSYGGMLVVVLSVAAAITFVPAILAVLGPRLNALPLRRLRAKRGEGFWYRLATQVVKHPIIVFVVALVFMLSLASPFVRARFGVPDVSSLPPSAPSRQGDEILKAQFGPGENAPILVALQSEGAILGKENVAAGYDFTQKLAADPRIKRVDGLFSLDPRITKEQYQMLYANPEAVAIPELTAAIKRLSSKNLTLLTIIPKEAPMADSAKQLVQDLRTMAPGAGLRLQVTGTTAVALDIESKLFGDFPLAIGIVGAGTFLALLVLFRSFVFPLKAVLTNGLSVLASYGAVVYIFQDGNFANLLGFTSNGFVDATAPIMLFCILFGLTMDYEMFLVARIKEAFDRTGNSRESVVEGLSTTGGVIASAAAIMVVVTGSFAATDLLTVKSIGLGAGVAIFFDTIVVRALLVPATMRLLGRWCWWAPGFLQRRIPKVAVE